MVTRVGSYAQQTLIMSQTMKTQAHLYERQDQLSTGKVGHSYQAVVKDSQRLVTIENQLSRAEQFVRNIGVGEKRITLMNDAVAGVSDAARTMHGLLAQTSGDSKAYYENDLALPQQARNLRDLVAEMLNTRDDSRYLFAGGRTDERPVQLNNGTYAAPTAPPMPAAADTSWYEGDDVTQQLRIDTSITVSYGVNADYAGFEKVIRALDTVANLTFSDPVTDAERLVLSDARGLLTTAMDEIKVVENELALNYKRLEDSKDRQQSFINFANNQIGEIENINTAQVISELNAATTQLEASYLTLSQIQRMSLANYL
ncbi:MAG: flagellin [Alphaproteobacteria bacterium]